MKLKFPINHCLLFAFAFALSGSFACAADYYFDVNGTTTGSGVTNGSSYAAGGITWNAVADGTGTPGGTVGTAFRGHTLVFSAGTDAAGASYSMTGFGTSYQMSNVRIEDGNVSLVGGSGFSSPTILTKTGASLNITGNWDFYGNLNTFNAEASSTITINSLANASNRSVNLKKTGNGLMTVTGGASGRGIVTAIDGGELRIQNGNAMFTSGYSATVTVNSGGTLELDNNITVANNPITINGAGFSNGSINLGALANYAGNNAYNSAITMGSASRINNNASGTTLTLNPASGNAVTGAFGLTMGGVGNITVSKPIDATVITLTKDGTGTLTLAGSHAHTGLTTISGGRLSIGSTGTINSTSSVSIGAGEFEYNSTTALTQGISFSGSTGTLSGIGTITPAVTITSGNRQTSGTSVTASNATAVVGKETFTNGITYSEGSIFEWNLNADNVVGIGTRGTAYDAVNTLSLATTGTKAIFRVILNGTDNFDEPFWNIDRTWSNIFTGLDGTSVLTFEDNFKSNVEYYNSAGLVTNANATRSFSISGSDLNWTAVPEPTSALAGLLITAGLLRRVRIHSMPLPTEKVSAAIRS